MNRIVLLSGTDRKKSVALRIANYLKPLYEAQGVRADVISLEDFPLEEAIGGMYGKKLPRIEAYRKNVIETDGIVMIIPEYNGSFPGILKLFIDYLPFPQAFNKMPIAFVGLATGAFGALRAVEQMQLICGYRNAFIYPERVFLQRISRNFDELEGIENEFIVELLDSQIRGFVTYTSQMKELQSA